MACKTLEEICECVSPEPDGTCYSPDQREYANWVVRLLCAIRAGGGGGGGGGSFPLALCRVMTGAITGAGVGDVVEIYEFYDTSVEPPVLLTTIIVNTANGVILDVPTQDVFDNSDPCPAQRGGTCDNPVLVNQCAQPLSNGTLVSSTVVVPAVIAAGFWSVSIENAGATNGVVDGVPLLPGRVVNLSGYTYHDSASMWTKLTPEIAIDGTGTTLIVRTFV